MNQMVVKEAYNRTTSYEYDKRGNRILETSIHTQENRRTFEWDETNRLARGTRGPDYGLYTSEYTYNGLGLRVNSTIMGPDKTIYDRDYVIDYTSPERNDLAEFNLGHYQWQGDKKVYDLTHLYNAAGQRLQTESARYTDWAGAIHYTRYIHEDIMGSSYYYTNPETGYVTNQHEHTTWGNNTKAPTYNYDPEYRASEPYFTGHPYDGSLNLYYAENRFYDPETGSFLSNDPVKSGLNWYRYCNSNPTTYVDLLGLFPATIREDDPFFFHKMQDSGSHGRGNFDVLKDLDAITTDELWGVGMGALWPEQQLLTAKYLTFFMLMDPFFNTKDFYVEMMNAAVGNMFCEAYPGKTEQYNERHNPEKSNKDYMLATLQRTNYEELADTYKGCASTMEAVNAYYALPNGKIGETITLEDGQVTERQGFGFGMCQFTFSRATDVMESYQNIYGDYKGSLTLGQRFAAEYNLMRNELNREEGYDNLIKQSGMSSKQFEADKIYSLGFTFREIYENPGDKSKYKDGGERAVKWHQILEEALYSATD